MGSANGTLLPYPSKMGDQAYKDLLDKKNMARTLTVLDRCHRRPNPDKCALSSCRITKNLLRCARCKYRYYCSPAHQLADWTTHQYYCKAFFPQPPYPVDRRVSEPVSLHDREELVESFVASLVMSLASDCFPPSTVGPVFGIYEEDTSDFKYIGVHFPSGALAMGCWSSLYRYWDSPDHTILVPLIKKALLAGDLPAQFQQWVSEMRAHCSYCSEMCLRNFMGIQWDQSKHLLLAGQYW